MHTRGELRGELGTVSNNERRLLLGDGEFARSRFCVVGGSDDRDLELRLRERHMHSLIKYSLLAIIPAKNPTNLLFILFAAMSDRT